MTETVCGASTVWVEEIPVRAFATRAELFACILGHTRKARPTVIHYLNIHVANAAHRSPRLKALLQRSDVVYCDGAGIRLGAWLGGQHIPARFTAADWLVELLAHLAAEGRTVFLLGGLPGVPERALESIERALPGHSVLGVHHGHILKDPALERQVIERINRLGPDLLIVGFGTPLQEFWMDEHRHELRVKALFAIGAVMDYMSGQVQRCPPWMGTCGLEWLFRFRQEPGRLMGRYLLGNPWFIGRVFGAVLLAQFRELFLFRRRPA